MPYYQTDASYLLFFEDKEFAVFTEWLYTVAKLNRHSFAREQALLSVINLTQLVWKFYHKVSLP